MQRELTSSGMVDHLGSNLDKPPDARLYRRFDVLAPECGIQDHMKQIVGKTSYEKLRLIGCKAMATFLVPSEGVLPLFDSVLNIGTTIVNLDHLL